MTPSADILHMTPEQAARLSGSSLAYALDMAHQAGDRAAIETFEAEWDYRNREFGTPEWCDPR